MFLRTLFTEGHLHRHLLLTEVTEREANRVYSYLLCQLIRYWVASNPVNIFAYNETEKLFFNEVRHSLLKRQGLLYLQSEFDQVLH